MKKWTKNNKMNQLEHTEQVNLMKWWALACRTYQLDERMLFAIPNGGQRNIIVAAKMKQEGIRSGIPDLFLAVPKKDYHGLFIEMKKVKGGRVSENQKEMINVFNNFHYLAIVCNGWIEAKKAIEEYLK